MDAIHPLKAYRESQSPPLTVRQLAQQLGTSTATVSRWETGERKPEPEQLPSISAKTGIPPRLLRPDLAKILDVKPRGRVPRAKAAAKRRAA